MLDLKLIDEGMQTRGTNQQKSWKFPKFHLLSHAFSGISEKGVTANYNTKLNEHKHRETRITFESGNQKDVVAQAISLLTNNSFMIPQLTCNVDSYSQIHYHSIPKHGHSWYGL